MNHQPTKQQPPFATTGLSSLPIDILKNHILTRLDGQTLASFICTATSLSLDNHDLWADICHSTWPSTADNHITKIISNFSNDKYMEPARSFFSHSFPLAMPDPTNNSNRLPRQCISTSSSPLSELISAVDIYYRNKPILTKTEETTTTDSWFKCSPFRIDILDPKEILATYIPYPTGETSFMGLKDDITLSWILIDPVHKRSMNLSSHKPVSMSRHWLSGEVQARFVSILTGRGGVLVECRIVVIFGGSEDGKMQVREVSLVVKDMDGKYLNGMDSLVILDGVMGGKRGSGVNRENEALRRYIWFEEMKRKRKEWKSKIERTFDIIFVIFVLLTFFILPFVLCIRALLI